MENKLSLIRYKKELKLLNQNTSKKTTKPVKKSKKKLKPGTKQKANVQASPNLDSLESSQNEPKVSSYQQFQDQKDQEPPQVQVSSQESSGTETVNRGLIQNHSTETDESSESCSDKKETPESISSSGSDQEVDSAQTNMNVLPEKSLQDTQPIKYDLVEDMNSDLDLESPEEPPPISISSGSSISSSTYGNNPQQVRGETIGDKEGDNI